MEIQKERFNIRINPNDLAGLDEFSKKDLKKPKKFLSKKKISLYKTEICKSFENSSYCSYGEKCQFAHSLDELRDIERHPRYKTELCKTYTALGACSYGKRCCFIHAGPENDEHTDRQDARNLPGDWKAPGLTTNLPDIEMSTITTDPEIFKTQAILTEEENEKLHFLSLYRPQPAIGRSKIKKHPCLSVVPGDFVGFKRTSSVFWAHAYHCFIYVDSLCTVISFKPLGKAPGTFVLNKKQLKL
ncbi:hypothetical protein NEHOM01_2354 [Nematocida homosporus]|uniref:uncharacterized protein n=1 Tax=Nematocida homosporus TaxID=1912981 RepID=UPI0022210B7C|nr:uncharacterized protein NEHOM01_2354 [Nematocida homosporus]KAI5187767.1 hypothetical protein NEHOM01_2354 [Nematocida homosporus]